METDVRKVPSELTAIDQWVAYTLPKKIPFNVETGTAASTTDSTTWTSFERAVSCVTCGSEYDGIGFVFTQEAGFVGIDLDGCRDPKTQHIADWAKRFIKTLGSYAEVSPSRTGIKIICRGRSPYECGKKFSVDAPQLDGVEKKPGIEVYSHSRYFTITGERLAGMEEVRTVKPSAIASLIDEIKPPKKTTNGDDQYKMQLGNQVVERARNYIAKLPPAVSGQGGHDATYHAACCLVRFGLTESQAGSVLSEFNERCEPPWNDRELEHKIRQAFKNDDGDRRLRDAQPFSGDSRRSELESEVADAERKGNKGRQSQSTIIVELAKMDDLWLGNDGDTAYATIRTPSVTKHHRLRTKAYKRTLSRRFYEAEGRTPSGTSISDALTVIEGMALHEGATKSANLRVAEHNGTVYLDLCNERWECVEVDAEGWRIIREPPVAFVRTKSMATLPSPAEGSVSDLLELLNVGPNEWPLVACWLAGALNPSGPYPIMILTGEQGSAKSTTARVLRSIVDPNVVPLRSQPRNERDLMIQATNGHCPVFDNLSSISNEMSDALCRISTGGGFSTRTLYDDSEETIFSATRPMVITGIGEVVRRSDLLDRCLIVELPVIKNGSRRTEKEFWAQFQRIHAGVLGGVLNGVSAALRNRDAIELNHLPRMADFAVWAVAASSGLGLGDGEFMRAYQQNREHADASAISHDVVADPLINFIRSVGSWEGTATELLSELNENTNDETTKQKAWPKAPHVLSKRLNQLAPNLRRSGLTIEHRTTGRDVGKKKLLHIEVELGVK